MTEIILSARKKIYCIYSTWNLHIWLISQIKITSEEGNFEAIEFSHVIMSDNETKFRSNTIYRIISVLLRIEIIPYYSNPFFIQVQKWIKSWIVALYSAYDILTPVILVMVNLETKSTWKHDY